MRRRNTALVSISVIVGMLLAFVVFRQVACLEDEAPPDDLGEVGEVDEALVPEVDDDGVVAVVPASSNDHGIRSWQVRAAVPGPEDDAVLARIDSRGGEAAVVVRVELAAGSGGAAKVEVRAGADLLVDEGRDAILDLLRRDLQSGSNPVTGQCDMETGNLAHNLIAVVDRCTGTDDPGCNLARTFYRDSAVALGCCTDPAWAKDPSRSCPIPVGTPGSGRGPIAATSGDGGVAPPTCTPGKPCCGRPEGWVEPHNMVVYEGYGHSHPMSGDFRDGCLGSNWTPPQGDNFCCTSANAAGTCNGGDVGSTGELTWGPILRSPSGNWWHDPEVDCPMPGNTKDCCPLQGDNCDRRTSNYPAGVQCKLVWVNKATVGGKVTVEVNGKLTTEAAFKVFGCGPSVKAEVGGKISVEGNITGEWSTSKEHSPTKFMGGCDCFAGKGCIVKVSSKTDWFLPADGLIVGKIGGVAVTRTYCGFDTKAGGNATVHDEEWQPEPMLETVGAHGDECRPVGSTETGYCGVMGGECAPPPGDAGMPPPPPDAASYPHSPGDAMPLPNDDPFDPGDDPNFP